ncbi:OTU domain-containing protein 6B [Cryptococcus neoformans c45]|nr:OTU domain-containing protein 6B [Cryptococcus neoformans var. grubii c45]
MPGSKRRALKKLLSPNHSPLAPDSPSADITPTSALSPQPELPPATDDAAAAQAAAAGISPQELQDNAVLEDMHEREKEIGHASAPAGLGGVISPSPSSTSTQETKSGGMYGGGMYANANGGGGGGKKKKSSRQRFEERQARKQEALLESTPPADPGWTAQLEKERQEEIKVISDACFALNRNLFEIAPDGHCMYAAIGDQLGLLGIIPAEEATNPRAIRRKAADYMLSHPDDFMPFLPSITGEDTPNATSDGMITPSGFAQYCKAVAETGEWGGEPEIQALSRAYGIPIHVIQRGPPTVVSHGGKDDSFGGGLTAEESSKQGERVVRISYHKRMYGLGEHYNSLRPVA